MPGFDFIGLAVWLWDLLIMQLLPLTVVLISAYFLLSRRGVLASAMRSLGRFAKQRR
jgi:hypothetical protein